MCVEKYTLEHRNLGQAEGAHKVGASERCSRNPLKSSDFNGERSDFPTETLAFRVESEATTGSPKMLAFLGRITHANSYR